MATRPVTFKTVDVSPELAQRWLKTNTNNRHISDDRVLSYAESMVAGEWRENGETIAFDTGGTLLNGQHRLQAVVIAERTVRMAIAENVDPAAITTIDTGRGRTVADYLGMQGQSHAGTRAAVAAMLVRMEKDLWTKKQIRVTADAAVKALSKYPELDDPDDVVIKRARAIYLETRLNLNSTTIGIILTRRVKPRISEDFEVGVLSGVNLDDGDPRLALRRFANGERQRGRRGGPRMQLRHLIAYLKAWNAFAAHKSIQQLRVADTEQLPAIFGAPASNGRRR